MSQREEKVDIMDGGSSVVLSSTPMPSMVNALLSVVDPFIFFVMQMVLSSMTTVLGTG